MARTTSKPALSAPPNRAGRAALRSWWADGLEAAVWLSAAVAVAFLIADGGLLAVTWWDYLYAAGRIIGLVAAVLMMTQVLLVSRAPWVERAFGHDRTVSKHTRLGKIAFVAMLVHVGVISIVTAHYEGRNPLAQPIEFLSRGWFMVCALIAVGAFAIVVATSLVAVRKRWRYEQWHSVHLVVYVAIAFAVPHQFLEGSTFRAKGAAWWFWLALYVAAFGSFLLYRVGRPLVHYARHRLNVESVVHLPDGSTSVTITGRNLARLRATGGQFFLWRFLAPGLWREAHPYSLSQSPTGDSLRITVKPSGDGSARIATLQEGTRVLAEGPLGIFTHRARSQRSLVLVAAGIGVTPIRAMLEEWDPADGECTVILRERSAGEAPLLDEVAGLAAERGATLHVLAGERGDGWLPRGHTQGLSKLAPHLATADVFICGPVAWAAAVQADARAHGVPPRAIHREQFAW